MKTVISGLFSVVVTFLSMPSSAQTFGANPEAAATSSSMPQHVSTVVYKNAADESQLAGTIAVNQIPGLGEGTNTSSRVKFFRPDNLGVANSRSNMLVRDDHASFAVTAPMPAVNGALAFVGTVYQTPLDSAATKWIQVLSLAATRRINAEFAYSAPIGKSGRFNSAITYKRHPAAGSGKPAELVASFQYSFKF